MTIGIPKTSLELRRLRANRTRQFNDVWHMMQWMLIAEAAYVSPDGLPLWWPLWSDMLKFDVRQLYRAGMQLAAAERHAENVQLPASSVSGER